ncbi:hypothetical protein VTN02DRAFT_4799 [Thermoascus thermophilus]
MRGHWTMGVPSPGRITASTIRWLSAIFSPHPCEAEVDRWPATDVLCTSCAVSYLHTTDRHVQASVLHSALFLEGSGEPWSTALLGEVTSHKRYASTRAFFVFKQTPLLSRCLRVRISITRMERTPLSKASQMQESRVTLRPRVDLSQFYRLRPFETAEKVDSSTAL